MMAKYIDPSIERLNGATSDAKIAKKYAHFASLKSPIIMMMFTPKATNCRG